VKNKNMIIFHRLEKICYKTTTIKTDKIIKLMIEYRQAIQYNKSHTDHYNKFSIIQGANKWKPYYLLLLTY